MGLASIELSFHPYNILRDSRRGVFRGNKNVGCSMWKRRFFALAVRITGELLKADAYILRGICKHQILFPSIQHLAWFPQGRPKGKQKCGKNCKNINLRRYFKFNREANCNTSIQTFIYHMCTTTLCNLCYIVVCCELVVYIFRQKVLQYLNFTKQCRAVCQW